ncbi:MAG TPA: universal stress protein [Pyrinomonadaceae bacterium]|jgi:nucleotide-binding universal stress UspA family protein|nr:universal stress protein [Pyrinomonadaceae bacterium]
MNKILNFERILCPVAQAHESDEGLRYAILIARSYGARLSVLTCNDGSSSGDETVEAMRTGIKRAIEHSFLSLPGSADAVRLDWDLTVVNNNRAEEAINREAASQNVDLIVMGSHRRSAPSVVVLGSTAEAVCRTAPCSVLVTRLAARHDAARTNGNLKLKKLLVATDFSSHSELALQYGLSLAQEYQSELHLVHVITGGARSTEAEISWTSQDTEGPYHAAARRLHESVPGEVHLWSNVTHAVREGKAYREIVSYAVEQDIDLICIGAHGQEFTLGTLFGTNTDRVLRQAPCPVLVTRPVQSEAEK